MTTRDRNDGPRKDQRTQPQASDQSTGERVAAEETEYQRQHQDSPGSGAPQTGGSRAESQLAGRAPDQPQSRQNIVNEAVNIEGEEEPEFQNAGGGLPRQRANQQSIGVRGREDSSIRGRESGPVRGEDAEISGEDQGISNRSSREENQRQEKVTPDRPESKPARSQDKRRAS